MPIAQDNSLGNLAGILGAIPGLSETINGKTTTSSTGISGTGLNYLLQQILSSNQGLASVAGGQNTAGLYNSTVQTQMVNDLLSRSAGEVASKTATTTTRQQPTMNLGDTILQGAAGLVGDKLLTKGAGALVDALGLGGTTTAGGQAAGASLLSSLGVTPTAFSTAGSITPAIADAAISGASTAGAAGAGSAVGAGITGSTAADAAAGGLGSALGATGAGALGAGLASSLGIGTAGAIGAATAGGMAAGGAALSGLGGAIAGDVAASSAGIAAGAGIGAAGATAAGTGIGAELASIGTALAAAWVICTELEVQGVISHETYQKAAPNFISKMRLKPSAVRGYHYWAIRYTKLMRRNDWIGKLAIAAIKPLATGRADYINGQWNLRGWITFNILEPICTVIGKTVARKPQNWKSLYTNSKLEK